MKYYSTFQICKILGIHHGRLRQWQREGFVKPFIEANGKGTRAYFTEQDLADVKKFMELVDSGYRRKAAAKLCLVK